MEFCQINKILIKFELERFPQKSNLPSVNFPILIKTEIKIQSGKAISLVILY